jgi:anti-sigma B factor antagonist
VPDDLLLTAASRGGGVNIVTVVGELDVATSPELREELDRIAANGGRETVVDLLAVSFVDSTALGILVEASRKLKARGGSLRIVCDDRRIARIMEITGLDRVLRLHATLREALESLGRPVLAKVSAR